MTRLALSCACAAAIGLPRSAFAGADGEWRALDAAAHQLELEGRFEAASESFAGALVAAASESSRLTKTSPASAAELAAWCEVLAEDAYQLTYWTQRPAELLTPFETARSMIAPSALAAHRELVWWLTYRLAELATRADRRDRAQIEYRRLGFVTDWRVIGPFENQKGGGFATPYPPETEVSFDAEYKGKKRPVRWRTLPVAPHDGVIDLDALFRPNDECIAYAVTYIRSPDARAVDIRVSTDDGYRLWVNRALVGSRDVERGCRFDQDVLATALSQGWNEILLKVADAHMDWEFSLRLTDRGGELMRELEVSSAQPRECPPAAAAGSAPPRTGGGVQLFENRLARIFACSDEVFIEVDPHDGRLAALASSAAGGLATALTAHPAAHWLQELDEGARSVPKADVARLSYGLGRLASSRGAHGVRDHPDRAALQRAVNLECENPTYLYALSRVATDWVLTAAERNENPRVSLLNDLLKAAPRAAVAHYELAAYYLHSMGNTAAAEKHVRAALQTTPEFLLAELLAVDVSSRRGFAELAASQIERIRTRYPQNPIASGRWARELARSGRAREAGTAFAAAAAADASVKSYNEGVTAGLIDSGKLYAAIKLQEQAVDRGPFDVGARLDLARLYEARGDHRAAAEICADALRIAPEDHLALDGLGRAMQGLGKCDEAQRAWAEALELEPNFVQLERYIEFISGKITYDRSFAEDVEPLIGRARAYVPPENDPLVEVLDKTIDRVNVDGTRSRTIHRIVQVRSSAGVEALGRQYVFAYPDEQVVKVRTVRVYRSDGSIEEAPTGDDGPLRAAGYAGRGVRVLDVPPLRAGDILEYEYRVDDTRQSFFGDYYGEIVRFQGASPRLRSKYVLIAPKGRVFHIGTRGGKLEPTVTEWPEGNALVHTWTVDLAPKLRSEPLMPPLDALGLQVHVSTYGDWIELGTWYWNLVKEAHQTDPELEAKTRELTAHADTELEKIRSVYDFVSSEIQYSAWEFGIHGFKPYSATKVFAQKFGDCKDKATLMKTMLGLAGIESFPALVRSALRRPVEDLSFPLFEHFNHMILYVPPKADRPALWLDGTTTLHAMEVVPVSDAGALACVVYPDGGRLMRIPLAPPGANSLVQSGTMHVALSGRKIEARLTLAAQLEGWCATFARYRFNTPESARRMLERLYARQFPALRVVQAITSDLEDIAVPAAVTFTAEIGEVGAARQHEGQQAWFLRPLDSPLRGAFRGEWSLLAPERLGEYAPLAKTEHDVVLSSPWRYEHRVTYSLSEELAFGAIPENVDLDYPFGRVRFTYALGSAQGARTLESTVLVEMRVDRIVPDAYGAFRTFVTNADRASRREIEVRRVR